MQRPFVRRQAPIAELISFESEASLSDGVIYNHLTLKARR